MKSCGNSTIIKISARAFTNPFLSSSSPEAAAASASASKLNCASGRTETTKDGGNPVTIFHFPNKEIDKQIVPTLLPSSELRSYLAKTCSWESVISFSGYPTSATDSSSNTTNRIWFYMPSGEEVSYCAHAAMAACSLLKDLGETKKNYDDIHNEKTIHFLTGMIDDNQEGKNLNISKHSLVKNIATVSSKKNYNADSTTTTTTTTSKKDRQENEGQSVKLWNEVTLQMPSLLQESEINHLTVLKLLDLVGLSEDDVLLMTPIASESLSDTSMINNNNDPVGKRHRWHFPSMINSSVARDKTLIAVKSVPILSSAQNPIDDILFRNLCDEIQSTGLYLYAPVLDLETAESASELSSLSSYECRQFPRFSGYPEDPATGIAAAALANSLYSRGIYDRDSKNEDSVVVYEMLQGTAMQKPSRIKISLQKKDDKDCNKSCNDKNDALILSCSGIVEVDAMEEMELPLL